MAEKSYEDGVSLITTNGPIIINVTFEIPFESDEKADSIRAITVSITYLAVHSRGRMPVVVVFIAGVAVENHGVSLEVDVLANENVVNLIPNLGDVKDLIVPFIAFLY